MGTPPKAYGIGNSLHNSPLALFAIREWNMRRGTQTPAKARTPINIKFQGRNLYIYGRPSGNPSGNPLPLESTRR